MISGLGIGACLSLLVPLALLTVLNLALEAYKWQGMAGNIQKISFGQAVQSVLTGLALGFVTPNRLGDFPGRALVFLPHHRLQVVFMNLLAGYAQFVVICILGLVSLCFIPLEWSWFMHGNEVLRFTWFVVVVLLLVFHLLVMFNTRSFLAFFARFGWLKKINQQLSSFPSPKVRNNLFSLKLSLLRSVVYTVQLIWLLHCMDASVPVYKWVLYANVYFFVLTVAPSFMLNKLGVRESLAVLVFADICENPAVPVVSVLLLWITNQVIPAMVGAYLLFKKGKA